jgi:uncharacterized membrane protein
MSDQKSHPAAARERQVIVFGLAIIAAYVLAVFLPDLVPAAAHRTANELAHARVVAIIQPSPQPSDQVSPQPSDQPTAQPSNQATAQPSGGASPEAGRTGAPSPGPSGSTAAGVAASPGPSGRPGTSPVASPATSPASSPSSDQASPGPGESAGPPVSPGTSPAASPTASPGDQGTGGVQALVLFLDGPFAGQQGQGLVQGPSGSVQVPDYHPGDEVVVEVDTAPDGTKSMALVDRWRLPLLGTLLGIFTVGAAAVAGWRGLRAVASLALTLVLTFRLFVPLVILGWSPVPLAVVFGIAVTVLSFMLTQGLTRTTLAAIAGTTLGLTVTGVLAVVATAGANFTPAQGSDQVVYLQQLTNGTIDLSGLLLAAVIFGGLGVLNDVSVSQAATVEELHLANPSLTRWQLFTRTMNVGTSHLAATINTLVFAYLGTALPLAVLLVIQSSNGGAALSGEDVAVEVMRTIVGAMGILAAVPLTTAIAVRWVVRDGPRLRPEPQAEPVEG